MDRIGNFLRFLFAFAFVTFATSGLAAPVKQWSIAVGPAQVAFGSVQVTLTIKNETPNGNSNINSLTVNLPTGYAVDTTKTTPVSTAWKGDVSYVAGSGGSVSIANMGPLKPQSSFTMTVWVNVGTSVSCGAGGAWTGMAWTGSSFSGDTFALIASTAYPGATNKTTVPASPALVFSTPPANTDVTHPVTFTISATNCGTGSGGVPVTATVKDASGAVVAVAPGTTGSDGKVTFTIPITTVGTYTITASSTNYPSVTATVSVFGGLLNCEPTPPFAFDSNNGITDPTQSGYAAGTRGFWNKDGFACDPLLYSFTNTILVDNTVHLAWDTTTGQHPAFTYSMTWKTEDVDNPANPQSQGASNYGWPIPRRPEVAWNTLGVPNFVPALACLGSALPAPYATLSSAIPATTAASITITVSAPPGVPTYVDPADHTTKNYPIAPIPATAPFSIVIGTERMLVTAVSGNNWTVTRGYGGTTKAAHDAAVYVMSTPLPIDLNSNVQVPMCVVNHGWMAAGPNPVTGIPQIRYFTTVYDIGDGWVRVGQ